MNARRRLWLWLTGGALLTPVLIPLLFFIGVWCVQGTYELMGYHAFVFNGEEIAKIAQEKGDPKECGRIRVVFAINTNTYLEAQYCTYTYAKLTSDPTACELLLPSEYGLSCINNVIAQEYKDHPDSGFFEFNECVNAQTDPLRQDWCQFVRAHKSHQALDCISIMNEVIRSGCTLKFEAWEKYPDLRDSFYFGQSAAR